MVTAKKNLRWPRRIIYQKFLCCWCYSAVWIFMPQSMCQMSKVTFLCEKRPAIQRVNRMLFGIVQIFKFSRVILGIFQVKLSISWKNLQIVGWLRPPPLKKIFWSKNYWKNIIEHFTLTQCASIQIQNTISIPSIAIYKFTVELATTVNSRHI